jgi:hypothetical protein
MISSYLGLIILAFHGLGHVSAFKNRLVNRVFKNTFLYDELNDGEYSKKSAKIKKSTKVDRIIDDFMGKRYGNGEFFYGKRTSDLSEEEFVEKTGGSKIPDDDGPLRENAILIVGGIETMAQWIAFDLAEKGFTIRIACEDRKNAIEWFGLPGNNVDIISLTSSSTDEKFARAVQVL